MDMRILPLIVCMFCLVAGGCTPAKSRKEIVEKYYLGSRLYQEVSHESGKRHGVVRVYDADGAVIEERVYKDGELIRSGNKEEK